jgi:Holliday junction resolvase RusA-like endonuclease
MINKESFFPYCKLKFHIKPQGKGRPRVTRRGHAYTPESTRKYENSLKTSAKSQFSKLGKEILKDAVGIRIVFGFKIPKSYSKVRKIDCLTGRQLPLKRPDVDNAIKAILDSLNGIVFHDDNQVAYIEAEKVYSKNEDYIDVEIIEILPE